MAKQHTIPYIYQLQNAAFPKLAALPFKVAVLDMDDAKLSCKEIQALKDQGKTVFSYVSIGEAEDYRDYWKEGGWSESRPAFLLKENPDWKGNFNVKFWDKEWQHIIFDRIGKAVEKGYDGVYLDIVDGYTVKQVIDAWHGRSSQLREEMVDFILKISHHAKALNPDFKIIPQNAVGLLSTEENINLDEPLSPNTRYLDAIDGVGKESTWFNDDARSEWVAYDMRHLENAINAGKFVLAIDYPTNNGAQREFIHEAIKAGYIPFIGTRELDGAIDRDNYRIGKELPDAILQKVLTHPNRDSFLFHSDTPGGFHETETEVTGCKLPHHDHDGEHVGIHDDATDLLIANAGFFSVYDPDSF